MSLGMGLFGLNYWHASKCASDRSPDEVEEMVAALKNRLLESESKVALRSTQCLIVHKLSYNYYCINRF